MLWKIAIGMLVTFVVITLFFSVVPDKYWPLPTCQISPITHYSSPSDSMVAWHIRTDCESKNSFESQIWLGHSDQTVEGRSVFAAPAYYFDRTSARNEATILHVVWKSEDRLEIRYSPEVTPRVSSAVVPHKDFSITVASSPISNTAVKAAPSGRWTLRDKASRSAPYLQR